MLLFCQKSSVAGGKKKLLNWLIFEPRVVLEHHWRKHLSEVLMVQNAFYGLLCIRRNDTMGFFFLVAESVSNKTRNPMCNKPEIYSERM